MRMSRVQAVLDRLVSDEAEVGVQVAAYLGGQLVVDGWAGIADPASRWWMDVLENGPASSCPSHLPWGWGMSTSVSCVGTPRKGVAQSPAIGAGAETPSFLGESTQPVMSMENHNHG